MIVATGVCGSRCARSILRSTAARSFTFLSAYLAAAHCGLPYAAVGAPINYGSHTGTSVSYVNVTEDTTTGDSQPLFGTPTVTGNSIDFNPVGFDAEASGAAGSDDTGGRLTFSIQAHLGNAITSVQFSEAGDTTLAGVGTDATSTAVTANGTIKINAVDGAAITPITRPISLSFTPSGGTYGLASDGGGLPIYHTQWTGSLTVNLPQILTNASVPFAFGATNISVDLVNLLTARSQAGTDALMNKHDFGGLSITAVVPEPASALLFAMGLVGCLAARKRPQCRYSLGGAVIGNG
jgi:PEP-CTERM motif